MVDNGYRVMKCPQCGFKADRDAIAVLNIEKKASSKYGGSLTTPTAPQMTDVNPNRCGELMNHPRRNLRPSGRGGGQRITVRHHSKLGKQFFGTGG